MKKLKLSKSQWEEMGRRGGWLQTESRQKPFITLTRLQQLIDENNAKYGTHFELGGAYGFQELWDKRIGERIEAGTTKDCYNAFVKVRFMEKYRTPVPPVEPTNPINPVAENSKEIKTAIQLSLRPEPTEPEDPNMPKMAEEQEIAKNILRQLGGIKFMAMTGAVNLQDTGNGLSFRLIGSHDFVKNGINYVKITLDPSDTYTVEFGRVRGSNYTVVKVLSEIYNDNLQEVFTRETGLDTHL